jgi:hypothetical protein
MERSYAMARGEKDINTKISPGIASYCNIYLQYGFFWAPQMAPLGPKVAHRSSANQPAWPCAAFGEVGAPTWAISVAARALVAARRCGSGAALWALGCLLSCFAEAPSSTSAACCGFNGEILGCFFPLLVPICYKCLEKAV